MQRYLLDLIPWFEALLLQDDDDEGDLDDNFYERAYAGIVGSLESATCSNVHCLIQRPEDLFTYPAAALMLADAVVLTGLLDFDAADNDSSWPSQRGPHDL
jgi:hypothetical protein